MKLYTRQHIISAAAAGAVIALAAGLYLGTKTGFLSLSLNFNKSSELSSNNAQTDSAELSTSAQNQLAGSPLPEATNASTNSTVYTQDENQNIRIF